MAQEMDEDQIIVVQETEYTGAGKHPTAQLTFAKENGVEILFGNPDDDKPGENIIFPSDPSLIRAREYDMHALRKSYIKNAVKNNKLEKATNEDVRYLADETKLSESEVREHLKEFQVEC